MINGRPGRGPAGIFAEEMSERREERERLRRERRERWRRETLKERRVELIARIVAIGVVGLIVAGFVFVLIATDEDKVSGAEEVRKTYAGLEQDGLVLGDPEAELVITEWADLQCPACRAFAEEELPELLELVRSGEARLEIRPFPILGPDSVRAATAAMAAARENRYFEFVDLFYRNQGAEGSGYVTDEFLRFLLEAAGVKDTRFADPKLERQVLGSLERAEKLGLQGTPSLVVRGPGGRELVAENTAAAVRAALERVR